MYWSGRTSWSYDARGRVVTETQAIGALGTYTTTYGYNSQDQVVATTYPDGEVVTTTYDIAGQPAVLSSSLEAGDLGRMSYSAQGQPKLITYTTASLVTHFGYYGYNHWGIGDTDDAPDESWANGHVGRLWKLCTVPAGVVCDQGGSGSSVLDLRYGYDGVGNILNWRDRTGGGDELQSFTYDALDRLETASGAYSANYSYDAIGNLLMKNEAGTNDTLEYTDPQHVHAPKVVNGVTYTYDENGNLLNRPGDSLTYDAENRLRSVTTAGETVTFTYDGDGRRVLRDTDTETTAYVGPHYELPFTKQPMPEDLDDDCQVTVIDIMQVAARWGQAGGPEDLDDSGTVDAGDIQRVAGQWRETCHVLTETVKYYSLGSQRIAMRRNNTLYYLFGDHLNSTSVTYRTSDGQTTTQRYYPWGTIRPGPANTLPTDRTFTGQQLDEPLGLLYYSAGAGYGRYYEPLLGRFTQPDTMVPAPGNPQDLNRYTYARNNPLRYRDSTGHWLETAWDIANIAWDLYEVRRDPSLLNIGALVVDVGAALLPIVPGGAGMVVRGGKAVAHVDDAARLARIAARTERFAGASPEVMRGVERLAKLVENERVPSRFRQGLAAELARAEEYFKAGKLRAVEFVEGANRYDLVLDTGTVVEVKYWRQSYAEESVGELVGQIGKYRASGRDVVLEFVRTKGDPVTESFIDDLLAALREAGINLSRENIRIVELE